MPNDSYSGSMTVKLTATQTIATNADSSSRPLITHDAYKFERVFSSRSPNPITLAIYHLYEDIDTTGIEIDLTSLPDINGGTKDATGKQLYAICVTNKTADSKLMIQNAALNSYPITTDNATASVASTVAATLVNTQDGGPSVGPEIMTLTIPPTAGAGSITLGSPFGHPSITLPYNVAATTVNWAVTWLISGDGTLPSATWTTASPSAGVFVSTYAANASAAIPTIATQGLLNIASSAVVTSIPAWGLHPTLITLGLQGTVVDATHKKIKLKAVSGTIDAEVTLWFIDAVV